MTAVMAGANPLPAETIREDWESAPRSPPASAAPVLAVAGFEGPLDLLLEMARAQQIDLATLSIVALVDAFIAALDAALTKGAARADLSRCSEWLVMAATLALLRSRLLLPPDAPEARADQDEAEAMRRLLLERAVIRGTAEWLDRPQLGRDAFVRGGVADAAAPRGRTTDITDLFRACLVALRVPDALARITRLLAIRPEGGALASFLPKVDGAGADGELRGRAPSPAPSRRARTRTRRLGCDRPGDGPGRRSSPRTIANSRSPRTGTRASRCLRAA